MEALLAALTVLAYIVGAVVAVGILVSIAWAIFIWLFVKRM